MNYIRKIRNGLFGFSLLFIALGIFLVVEPDTSAAIICYLFGGLVLICGIIDLIIYISNKKQRKYYRFDLIKCIITLAVGLFIVLRPSFVMAILPTLFALVLLFDGITKTLSAFDLRATGTKMWIPIMILGALICLLGLLVILNPFTTVSLPMIVIGIALICDGITNIWCNICLTGHADNGETTH